MERDIGPRVGGRFNAARQSNVNADDVDVNAYIERTPKTNEQFDREKTNAGWEYSFWVIVIIGIVIVLLVLVIWFMFKKDETVELQRQIQPPPGYPRQQQQQHNPNKNPNDVAQKSENGVPEVNNDDNMAADARANLNNKKTRRNIGPVPGEIPDNPAVVDIVPNPPTHTGTTASPASSVGSQLGASTQSSCVTESCKQVDPIDPLPESQVPLITNRLIANLGLTE